MKLSQPTLLLKATVGMLSFAFAISNATAQSTDWPTRTIKMIVPFGPGSTPDILARLVADKMTQNLKQSVIVENRAGAGGNIGTQAAAKAAPDGYTIGINERDTVASRSAGDCAFQALDGQGEIRIAREFPAHNLCRVGDHQRHALPDVTLRASVLQQRIRRPTQHVDEPRRDRDRKSVV